jgi:hypothetical protein
LRNAHAVSDMGISTLSWIERGRDGEPGSPSALPLSVASPNRRLVNETAAVRRSRLQSLGKGHGKIAELPVNGRELPVVLLVARPV